MNSSVDGGGLGFRGTEATLKIDRDGFAVHREGVPREQNPVLTERSFKDGTISRIGEFLGVHQDAQGAECPGRNRGRGRARRPYWQLGVSSRSGMAGEGMRESAGG